MNTSKSKAPSVKVLKTRFFYLTWCTANPVEIHVHTVKKDAFQMQIHVSSTQGSDLCHCQHIERPPRSGQTA